MALLGLAFGMFLYVIKPVEWLIPLDLSEAEKLHKRYKTLESFYEYIIEDYIGCIKHCLTKHKTRSNVFNAALYSLIVGVIILMVIKFRGSL